LHTTSVPVDGAKVEVGVGVRVTVLVGVEVSVGVAVAVGVGVSVGVAWPVTLYAKRGWGPWTLAGPEDRTPELPALSGLGAAAAGATNAV
jgi:hypothetical protein